MRTTKLKKSGKRNFKRGCAITSIVLASIIGFIALFVGILAILNVVFFNAHIKMINEFEKVETNTPAPVLNENGTSWTFVTDEEFKVLQLTDIHIGAGAFSNKKDNWAINAVATLIQEEKPNLVIVTGDIAFPVPYAAASLNNKKEAEVFATLMENLGVYWAFSFGNHDTEIYSYYSREQISEFYLQDRWEHCLFLEGEKDVDGYGNYNINVKNSKGLLTHSFIMMDSHSYRDGDYFGIAWKYDQIHENQIAWYEKTIKELNQTNKNTFNSLPNNEQTEYLLSIDELSLPVVKSSLFFHIPTIDYRNAWREYAENDHKDTENVKIIGGMAGETDEGVFYGTGTDEDVQNKESGNEYKSTLFRKIEELGSTKNLFCGHDHLNTFTLSYYGINLTYGMSIDYLAYTGIWKKYEQRGGTLLTLNANGSLDVEQKPLTAYSK